jgi:hypothetical protein
MKAILMEIRIKMDLLKMGKRKTKTENLIKIMVLIRKKTKSSNLKNKDIFL